MLRNMKLLSVILALIMALTITSQAPAFALENDAPEQPVVEESTEPGDAGEQAGEAEENSGEAEVVENTEDNSVDQENAEGSGFEAQELEDPELTAMGSVITATGLKMSLHRRHPSGMEKPLIYQLQMQTLKETLIIHIVMIILLTLKIRTFQLNPILKLPKQFRKSSKLI